MTSATALLTDPTFGLPVLLVGLTVVAWLILNLQDRPVSVVRSTPRPVPDRDPVSRTIVAFRAGRYSEVLDRARERLDVASQRRFGRPARRLPRTVWGARRIPGADPMEIRRLRRLESRVALLRDVTLRRELGIWMRLAFWRSHAELLRRFRAQLGPVLAEVRRATGPGGGRP